MSPFDALLMRRNWGFGCRHKLTRQVNVYVSLYPFVCHRPLRIQVFIARNLVF